MGVYVFESIHLPWLKVGHHMVAPRRPNAYYRIAGRGFYSVIHPPELDGRLSMNDFRLVAWYPNLLRKDETSVHRLCDKQLRKGEFHPLHEMDLIRQTCEALGGEHIVVTEGERKKAQQWGARRAKQAQRRRAKLHRNKP